MALCDGAEGEGWVIFIFIFQKLPDKTLWDTQFVAESRKEATDLFKKYHPNSNLIKISGPLFA